jgi:hypothetical protein
MQILIAIARFGLIGISLPGRKMRVLVSFVTTTIVTFIDTFGFVGKIWGRNFPIVRANSQAVLMKKRNNFSFTLVYSDPSPDLWIEYHLNHGANHNKKIVFS